MSIRTASVADSILDRFGVTGPPVPDGIVYLGDRKVYVRVDRLPPAIGGMLYREKGGAAVIWLKDTDPPTRRRFTLFHELGHLLLHPNLHYCHVDGPSQTLTEREADSFAADILMPRSWIEKDCTNHGIDELRLAHRYRVSVEAMEIRLHELGIL